MTSSISENQCPHPQPARQYYTFEELTALRKAAKTPEDELRIRLQAQAGLRNVEAATFSLPMVDLHQGVIHVKSVKTGWFRDVPLHSSLRRHIEMMQADGLLTYALTLDCLHWSHRLSRIIHAAGVKAIPNGLRRGYAVHREAQGVGAWQVGVELGILRSALLGRPPVVATPLVSADTAKSWFSE